MIPTVYFVGAGPGAPDLLTARAIGILRSAELIVYDDLIHPNIFSMYADQAKLIPIGYRGDPTRKERPDILNEEIIHWAKEGRRVVRLKGGDPLLYSRFSEEYDKLAQQDILVEVIPGVSSGFAGLSSLGIPSTKKGVAGQVIIESPHSSYKNQGATRLVYMPHAKIQSYCRRLLTRGYRPDTPAAYIQGISSPLERVSVSNLETLHHSVYLSKDLSPGLVIVGDVLNDHKIPTKSPCLSLRIALTSLRRAPSKIETMLTNKAHDVVKIPLVQTKKVQHSSLAKELSRQDHTIMITSPEAVLYFKEAMIAEGYSRRFQKANIVALGTETQKSLKEHFLYPDITIEGFHESYYEKALAEHSYPSIIVLGERQEFPGIKKKLEPYANQILELSLYENHYQGFRMVSPPPQVIVATSVRSLSVMENLTFGINLKAIPTVCMGASIYQKAKDLGYETCTRMNMGPQLIDDVIAFVEPTLPQTSTTQV